MRQEFFGCDKEEALEKASRTLKIPASDLVYQLLPETFGKPFKPRKVAVVVEFEENRLEQKVEEPKGVDNGLASMEDPKEKAAYLLDGIFKRMDISTSTRATEKGEHVVLMVQIPAGKIDLHRGESRELRGAVQFLINRMVAGGTGEEPRFIVDIGGKLEERSVQLTILADELARKVEEKKTPLHIRLMDSQDRRLLHLGFTNHGGVASSSQGYGRFRILSVVPKSTGG